MPLETNLNVTPYHDDFDESKKFYKILFRPGVAVQTRELNQIQSIMQNQIERFGNHVFKNGTIVSGINFEYLPYYPYIKLKDTNVDGQPIDLEGYQQYWLRNTSNLVSKVVNYVNGVEAQDPNVGTLYIRYLNSGSSNSALQYSPSDVLTVYDIDNPLFQVKVNGGGANFSNSDDVVFLSALVLENVVNGPFGSGNVIVQEVTGAKAEVIESNTTAIPGSTILKIKPLTTDLSNTSINSTAWTFELGNNRTISNGSITANVASFVGTGAVGEIVTLSTGVVSSIQLTSRGSGYTVPPYTTIKPTGETASFGSLNLQSQNYLTQITVSNVASSVGNGYAFGVTDGIMYQKGHFLKVDKQVVIVDKYSNAPNNVVVGFDTAESIVTSRNDTSLLDNATGSPNFAAPGANRIKLTPQLFVTSIANAATNTAFVPLVEFVAGFPYKENRVTVYNTLAKEFERRTHESAGDYVIDQFVASTKELISNTGAANITHYQVVVDPGTGYIAGQRVQTLRNTLIEVPKATTLRVSENQLVTASYGQYVIVKEMAGSFDTTAGGQISLRDVAQQRISNTSSITSISAPGAEIGTARVRSVVYNSGIVGTPSALYEVYLFDIQMKPGKNFRDVRALYADNAGITDGVADCVLELDPTLNTNVAVLKQSNDRRLVFDTGIRALNNVSSTDYTFKTRNTALQANASGYIDITLTQTPETFPYAAGASLTTSQKEDFIIVPTANIEASANLTGNVVITNNQVVGTGTTFGDPSTSFIVGDYIKVSNGANTEIVRISTVSNSTSATVSANVSASVNGVTANITMFFPAYRPINFTSRDTGREITISANSKVATANLGTAITGTATGIMGTFNVRRVNASQLTRTVYRNVYVKLDLDNNVGGFDGPWCLGVPDAIRLKGVYLGSNTNVDTTNPNVTKFFTINPGQNDDYYGHSHLYLNKGSNLTLNTGDWLLVKFDVLTGMGGGYSTRSSFIIDDTKTLSVANTTIHTLEIPDYKAMDLRNAIDFRPAVNATATVTNAVASATVNPANTIAFNSGTLYFPVPDSAFKFSAQYYLSRIDRVILTRNGDFEVINGNAGTERLKTPPVPLEALSIGKINVPAYPSIGFIYSNTVTEIAAKSISYDGKLTNNKSLDHVITVETERTGQPQQYTMKDIVSLENRIRALEYQASFNSLENNVNRVNIPSSIDPTINRFKNGFFVDSFIDTQKVDQQHPEFSSYIDFERGELSPDLMHVNLQMKFNEANTAAGLFNSTLLLPFTEHTLISQPKATSTVQSEGNRSQFVGEMEIDPSSFNVEAMFERNVTINLHREPSGGGSYGSCGLFKIICSKLYELGYLPHDIFVADQKFGEQLRDNDPEAYYGYIKWARIVVDWMDGKGPQCMFWIRDPEKRAEAQKHLAIKWARRIATPWANHMAYIMGIRTEDSRAGRMIMKTGLFVSRVVGKLFKDQKQTPTTNTAIGFGMWGIFALFYILAGIKDRKI